MRKVIISVLGRDRPGIVAGVSRLLFELDSNIENVSQTSLQSEFAGIFIAAIPRGLALETLRDRLQADLGPMGLQAVVLDLFDDVLDLFLGETAIQQPALPGKPDGAEAPSMRTSP